jgi:hypothetical protein
MSELHIGLDLGKNWFHIVGLDQQGRSVLQKKTSRAHLVNMKSPRRFESVGGRVST